MPAGRESKKSVLEEDAILKRKYTCIFKTLSQTSKLLFSFSIVQFNTSFFIPLEHSMFNQDQTETTMLKSNGTISKKANSIISKSKVVLWHMVFHTILWVSCITNTGLLPSTKRSQPLYQRFVTTYLVFKKQILSVLLCLDVKCTNRKTWISWSNERWWYPTYQEDVWLRWVLKVLTFRVIVSLSKYLCF